MADIVFGEGALSVTYRIATDGIEPALAGKLQFQLVRLKLNERYTKQINQFISEQKTGILMISAQGSAVLSDYLLRSAASLAQSFHRNDWRVALLRALADDLSFCAAPQGYLGE